MDLNQRLKALPGRCRASGSWSLSSI